MASSPYPDYHRGTWKMKYRPDPNGKWVSVTLGPDSKLAKKGRGDRDPRPPEHIKARAAEFAEIEYRAKHGLTPARQQPKNIKSYADDYMKKYPEKHDSGSVVLATRYINEFVEWCAERGISTVQGVNDGHCQLFLKSQPKGRSGNTLRTVKGYISGLFAQAVFEKLIPANPWSRTVIEKNTKPKKKPRFWTEEEVRKIIAACRQTRHQELVVFLVNTGIRISAALAMTWEWVKWDERKITVPEDHNKGGFEYDVDLSDKIHDLLARRLAESKSEYVFVNKEGNPYTYAGGADPIERAIAKSGVRSGTPHDLRHTFGRWLHLAGVPQSAISAALGHASLATTEIYVKMDREDALRVIRRLSIGLEPASLGDGGSGPPKAIDPSSGNAR